MRYSLIQRGRLAHPYHSLLSGTSIAISRVVKAKKEGEKVLAPVDFPTYEAAERYTRRVGLVKAYQLRTRYQEYSREATVHIYLLFRIRKEHIANK